MAGDNSSGSTLITTYDKIMNQNSIENYSNEYFMFWMFIKIYNGCLELSTYKSICCIERKLRRKFPLLHIKSLSKALLEYYWIANQLFS